MTGPAPSGDLPRGAPRALTIEEFDALAHADAARAHGCRVVDARDPARPSADHLPGSAWIPWEGRLPAFLLPARGQPLVVWAQGDAARERAARLTAAGWPAFWFGEEVSAELLRPGPAPGALWDIDPLLRRHLGRLPTPEAGPVLDLGSGSSREGIFLAQRGHDVVLVDRLQDALELGRQRAAHQGPEVAARVETRAMRLRRAEDIPPGPFAVILDFRFLRRGVLEGIPSRLGRDGWLFLRVYGKADEGAGLVGRGPRRASERLGEDEARALLGDGWQWIEPPRRTRSTGALWVTAVGRRMV